MLIKITICGVCFVAKHICLFILMYMLIYFNSLSSTDGTPKSIIFCTDFLQHVNHHLSASSFSQILQLNQQYLIALFFNHIFIVFLLFVTFKLLFLMCCIKKIKCAKIFKNVKVKENHVLVL